MHQSVMPMHQRLMPTLPIRYLTWSLKKQRCERLKAASPAASCTGLGRKIRYILIPREIKRKCPKGIFTREVSAVAFWHAGMAFLVERCRRCKICTLWLQPQLDFAKYWLWLQLFREHIGGATIYVPGFRVMKIETPSPKWYGLQGHQTF